jgi:hypothetical protein
VRLTTYHPEVEPDRYFLLFAVMTSLSADDVSGPAGCVVLIGEEVRFVCQLCSQRSDGDDSKTIV